MTILIIEDEQIAAHQLSNFITRHNPQANVAAILPSVKDSLHWFLKNEMPDLLFSDIELLDGNIFALFDQIKVSCPIIFSTAYDKYLLNAFKVNGIEYLLKPYDYEQFEEAMQKYVSLKSSFCSPDAAIIHQLQHLFSTELTSYKKRFSIRMKGGIYLLSVEDIHWLKSEDGLVIAYSHNGKKYPLPGTLTQIETQLNPTLFFRINRSEIINIHAIERLESATNDRLSIQLKDGKDILIASTSRTPELRKWLDG